MQLGLYFYPVANWTDNEYELIDRAIGNEWNDELNPISHTAFNQERLNDDEMQILYNVINGKYYGPSYNANNATTYKIIYNSYISEYKDRAKKKKTVISKKVEFPEVNF